ncbi:MAG: glycosyltransferase family 4 protein [Crenarchaeota archaeon]|nr:glycosyltransferase family 4 protein [Thermoproteota archaeon]
MIDRICHIGPALDVQGGISSVLVSYKKLFGLSDKYFIASYNGSFLKSLPKLFLVCLKLLFGSHKHFDFYQIHTSSYGSFFRKYLISLCLRSRKQKYTAHIHGSEFDKFCTGAPSILKRIICHYFRKAKVIIVLSGEMETFLRNYDPSLNHFATVPNPGENIAANPVDLKKHELPVKIIFSGRFGKRKGVFDLLMAYHKAEFSVPVTLHLFGDGEINKVKELVLQNGKKESIYVSPWLKHEEYIKQLSSFDILVLPSYAERFSMSLVEALGMGIPVISTFVGGTAEVVENNVCGFLHQPGDILALKNALEALVNDADLRIRMGQAGWERASTRFTGTVVKGKIETVYQSIE